MKKGMETLKYRALTVLMALMTGNIAFAQEEGGAVSVKTSSTSTTSTESFVVEPWMWIVGAAVLILLLALIIGGSGSRSSADRTTVHRTTVTRQDDVYDA